MEIMQSFVSAQLQKSKKKEYGLHELSESHNKTKWPQLLSGPRNILLFQSLNQEEKKGGR